MSVKIHFIILLYEFSLKICILRMIVKSSPKLLGTSRKSVDDFTPNSTLETDEEDFSGVQMSPPKSEIDVKGDHQLSEGFSG